MECFNTSKASYPAISEQSGNQSNLQQEVDSVRQASEPKARAQGGTAGGVNTETMLNVELEAEDPAGPGLFLVAMSALEGEQGLPLGKEPPPGAALLRGDFASEVATFKQLDATHLQHALMKLVNTPRETYDVMPVGRKIVWHLDIAARAQALGEQRLTQGNKVPRDYPQKAEHLLAGLNLDMGGEALGYLELAKEGVRAATVLTKSRGEQDQKGSKRVEELEKAASKIDSSIGLIDGKHDIPKAMNELTKFLNRGTDSWGEYHKAFSSDMLKKPIMSILNSRIALEGSDFIRNHASKLLRDQALHGMARASHLLDRGDVRAAQDFFAIDLPGKPASGWSINVNELLADSQRMTPDHPDLPALKELARKLDEQMKTRAKAGW